MTEKKVTKKEWLYALPNTGKPLLLTDSSVTHKVKGKDGRKDTVEMFHVSWNEKELKTPKQVPNSAIMTGYANIGHIILVDDPKKKKASGPESTGEGE